MKPGNKILFVIIFLTIIAGLILYFEASAFQKTAKITEGVVTDYSTSYFFVQYISDDGVERTFKGSQKKNGKIKSGEKMKVYYQTDNPDKARVSNGVKSGKKFFVFAAFLLLVNIVSVYQDKKRNTKANKFKTTGRKVEAEVMKIDTDLSITALKKHPYMIDIRWADPFTGREYTHTIRAVWQDPKILLAGRNTIDVYIDRENPEDYFLDIEFMGPAAR